MQNGERRIGSRSPYQVNLAFVSKVANSHDLVSFDEASKKQEWRDAMQVEFDALMKNKTWKLVELPLDGSMGVLYKMNLLNSIDEI